MLRVTLSPRGVLLLNKLAYEALDTPPAVKLLFDERNNRIGLKAQDPRRTNAFPVRQKDKWQNYQIRVSPFCKHHAIKVTRTILFNDIDLDDEGALTLELAKTTIVGHGK